MKYFFLLIFFVFGAQQACLLAQDSTAVQQPVMRTPPDTVKVGAYIISLHDVNFHDKEYTLRFWLWLLHKNEEFEFSSQIEIPNAKSLEKPDIQLDSAGGYFYCLMKMKANMKQSWNVSDYPFDKQYLSCRIEHTIHDARSLVFVPDHEGSNFDPGLTVDGWHVRKFSVDTGSTLYKTAFGYPTAKDKKNSVYSNFSINMELERNAWGLFFKLFLGMYIAFLISSVSFLVDPEEVEPRFALPVGGLFAAVGNKYIIDSLLPESSQFTLVDSLHTITFLFIFFTVAFSAISLIWAGRNEHDKALRVNKKGGIIIFSSYLFINLVLILIALF
ncbi:MAG: hypothetical protein MUF42_17460 [Cytophagaceae bacterium]|jgi:hypothetical protein|nr:hypothetical protein [Cytophagaceae bacterium]